MKRSKDDEKLTGPMFPRLHVNDTEKGGPRAPPRNKMALYEQLSIPSQKFRNGMTPLDNSTNPNNTPPASSSQGNAHDRGVFIPAQVPPPRHAPEKPRNCYPNSGAPASQLERRKKFDEDDFAVPIFIHSKMGLDVGKFRNTTMDIDDMRARNNTISHNVGNIKDIVASRKRDGAFTSLHTDVAEGPLKQRNTNELRDDSSNNFTRSQKAECRSQAKQRADIQQGIVNGVWDSQPIEGNYESSSMSLRKFQSEERRKFGTESNTDNTCRSVQTIHGDRGDDASETSMVECISGTDVSPDDVVGIIGQKHFWKARSAIVKQQRAFAIQVFELHRLIKVQKLIAESPHLLLDDSSYIGKTVRASNVKKLPMEYIVKAHSGISKQKSDFEKQNQKLECSAENTVGKASLSTVQNGTHPSNYRRFTGSTPVPPIDGDLNTGSWSSHPPPEHQWLIPVMSPTEGLVYKPYPGPGFTRPVCGGCGPLGSAPVVGNFPSPGYGVPASHHQYQGMGVPTFVPSAGPHGYFPPYGMPVMHPAISDHVVDQMNPFTPHGLQRQLSDGAASFSAQHPNTCDLPSQNNGVRSDAIKSNVCTDGEVQISTASSPTKPAPATGLDKAIEGNNALPLFPTSPVLDVHSGSPKGPEADQPTQVIRVVPHNRRTATESAARIFRSIQEERRQYDSA